MSKLMIEDLIRILLPLLPDAEVSEDKHGQIVIRTGITAPGKQA